VTPAGKPGASAANGLDLQTSQKAAVGGNSVSRAVTNRIAAAKGLIELLAARWPNCFFIYQTRRRPLKRGIRGDIWAALNNVITYTQLKAALGFYCLNHGHLLACKADAPRIDLDGNIVGTVSAEEAKCCADRLAARSARKASKKETPAPADSAAPRRLGLADLKAAAATRRLQMKTPTTGEVAGAS
jgi:sRNA-binding protein